MDVDEETKSILLVLAQEYEGKTFMPNVASVKGFLSREGEHTSGLKSRQQATARVFRRLALWDPDRLRHLRKKGEFGPPKTLRGISEAIEGYGSAARQTAGGGPS